MIVLRWQKRLLWHYSVVRISVLQTLPTEFCFSTMHCRVGASDSNSRHTAPPINVFDIDIWHWTVAAICHKSWGPGLSPPLSLLQFSFLPFPVVDSPGGLGRARSPAAKYFDAIYTNRNSLIKSTLMFNVIPGTEISMHAEFSHCRQNWYHGLQAIV